MISGGDVTAAISYIHHEVAPRGGLWLNCIGIGLGFTDIVNLTIDLNWLSDPLIGCHGTSTRHIGCTEMAAPQMTSK